MPHITFHCRTISPMFIGGADPDVAELRPPSLKGALRFWERAVARHWIFENELNRGENHIALLRHDEALWGGAFTVQQKSEISVEINHSPFKPIKGDCLQDKGAGLKYLLFTLAIHNKEKEGIPSDTWFQVTFRCKSERAEALPKAIAAFWALTYFGALGTRARRGAGAFEVIRCEGFDLPAGISFSPHGSLHNFLRTGLETSQRLLGVPEAAASPRGYSTIGKQIWVSKRGFGKWEDALEEIGGLMLKHRKAIPNRDRSKRKFTMDTLDQKAAFGLPIGVYEDNEVNFLKSEDTGHSRRASPLFITLVRGIDSKIYWVVTHLDGQFMETADMIAFKSCNKKARCRKDWEWPRENPALLRSFLDKLSSHANRIFQNTQS